MDSKKIIIATALLILISSFLASCGPVTEEKTPEMPKAPSVSTPEQIIKEAIKVKKDVEIELSSDRDGDQITVKIILNNPNGKAVTSAQSWLSYDPDALEGERINVDDSSFIFTAPYDNTFDEVNGLVMIGRANNEPVTAETINVAEVVFTLKEDGTTMIDTYDYQNDVTGHTSANMLLEDTPYNVLLQPESPALIIQ